MPLLLFSRTKARAVHKWRWKAVLPANKKFQSKYIIMSTRCTKHGQGFETMALLSIYEWLLLHLYFVSNNETYISHLFKKSYLHYVIIQQAVLLTLFFQNVIICLTCICFELGCMAVINTLNQITLASNLIFSVIVTIAFLCSIHDQVDLFICPFPCFGLSMVITFPVSKKHIYVCNLWSE